MNKKKKEEIGWLVSWLLEEKKSYEIDKKKNEKNPIQKKRKKNKSSIWIGQIKKNLTRRNFRLMASGQNNIINE